MWPPMVLAALAADDIELAERLMAPVITAQGLVPPFFAAQRDRLRGLIESARGTDPERVEADLRAGVAGLAAFGAVGYAARAQEELAGWLISQGRADEAEPLLADVGPPTCRSVPWGGWPGWTPGSRPTS